MPIWQRQVTNREGGVRNLRVNGDRLWARVMELPQTGATSKGGVCRLAASDPDGEARRLLIGWSEAAGCTRRGRRHLRAAGTCPECRRHPVGPLNHVDKIAVTACSWSATILASSPGNQR